MLLWELYIAQTIKPYITLHLTCMCKLEFVIISLHPAESQPLLGMLPAENSHKQSNKARPFVISYHNIRTCEKDGAPSFSAKVLVSGNEKSIVWAESEVNASSDQQHGKHDLMQ